MGNLRENILGSVGIIFWKRYAKLSNTHLIYSTYYSLSKFSDNYIVYLKILSVIIYH